MSIKIAVKKNTCFNSVSLTSISTRVNKLNEVKQAFVAMAAEMNKGVLKNLGLLAPELEKARSGSLTIVIKGTNREMDERMLIVVDELFAHKKQGGRREARYATIANARGHAPESNLAMISVDGLFVAYKVRQTLQNNLSVMLLSDNVSLEDGLGLKHLAHKRGLLVIGSDYGTTIINSAALCFGNAVRRDSTEIIGASDTGGQELSIHIHEFGDRISRLVGIGGHGMSEKADGLMMLDMVSILKADP